MAMVRRTLAGMLGRCAAAAGAALVLAGTALSAQEYRFQIPEAAVTVTIEPQGSARIHYRIRFLCVAGFHAIDVVDIGMPNLSRHEPLEARLDGKPLPAGAIGISSVLKPRGCGYEIRLGDAGIQPGTAGVFEFSGREVGMVWQDTTRPDLASFRFSPTWFGEDYVVGQTRLTVRFILPIPAAAYPEAKERILWQRVGQEFGVKGVMAGEDQVSVGWARELSWTRPWELGVSFPRTFVTAVRKDSAWGVFRRWFASSPARRPSGVVLAVLFGGAFLYATRLTGWALLVLLEACLIFGMVKSVDVHLALVPIVPLLGILAIRLRRGRRRHYFPAETCVEGGGLRRGLTAVESAVVLERPFTEVLTMVIYGLVRKGAVEVVSQDPLRLAPRAQADGVDAWCAADGTPLQLHDYELAFMNEFRRQRFGPVADMDLRQPFERLLSQTAQRMRGFSLDLTRAYSRFRTECAWQRVRRETGFEARCRSTDENLDWLMLDTGWGRGLDDLDLGRRYWPGWWQHHGCRNALPVGGPGSGTTLSTPQTHFADVTRSLCGRLEGLCSRSVAGIDSLKSPGIDLRGVDRFTGEMLNSMAEGRGGGGGGGCACACACAGGGR